MRCLQAPLKGEPLERLHRDGAIYCLGSYAARAVKIGWTSDPWQRLQTLQCGNPEVLMIHSFFPGGREIERGLHDVFSDLRLNGEWFDNIEDEVRSTFKELAKRIIAGGPLHG